MTMHGHRGVNIVILTIGEILDSSLFDEFGISDEVVIQSVLDKKDTEDNEGCSNLLIE